MAGMLDGIDSRTRLVGENRLELLIFRLGGNQLYGINVFKVQEVIRCPTLTRMPHANGSVIGIANMRGRTISVIDLSLAIGYPAMPSSAIENAFVVIADYNRSIQGFLVYGVERIVNMNWESILAPPKGSGGSTYLTAVTRVDNKLVEIIDVEKILSEIAGEATEVSSTIMTEHKPDEVEQYHVLIADDSMVARNQIKRTLDQLGIQCSVVKDGQEALEFLKDMAKEEGPISNHISLVISDVEMPNMDGYTLTTEIRKNDALKDLYIILHTSLSGVFNQAMVQKVGANKFIPKFKPDELAMAVLNGIEEKFRNKSVS